MATQIEEQLITGAELFALEEQLGPAELVRGRIVQRMPPGPMHAGIEADLTTDLTIANRLRRGGWVMTGEVGIYVSRDPDSVRMADIAFISKERIAALPEGYLEVAPELIVEIISPTSTWEEMKEKIDEYFAIGVLWVWIVEPKRRSVSVYHSPSTVTVLAADDTLLGKGVLEGFSVPVHQIFASLESASAGEA